MSSELQVQGAVEGDQIPGGSCCINSQGWLWVKHRGAPRIASEHLLPPSFMEE